MRRLLGGQLQVPDRHDLLPHGDEGRHRAAGDLRAAAPDAGGVVARLLLPGLPIKDSRNKNRLCSMHVASTRKKFSLNFNS